MNRKYDRTDRERDQVIRVEQSEAERKKAEQGGTPGRGGQQQAQEESRRQHGGWTSDKENRSGPSGSARDGDSSEKLVDEP